MLCPWARHLQQQRKSCPIVRGSGFAVGLVNSILELPDGQLKFLGKFSGEILITDEAL